MPTDELVVLSHLRWHFVWQRPQHLISRLAARRPTWFVEEPIATSVDEPVLRWEASGPVTGPNDTYTSATRLPPRTATGWRGCWAGGRDASRGFTRPWRWTWPAPSSRPCSSTT
jgi:hypothetical protein